MPKDLHSKLWLIAGKFICTGAVA